MLFLARPANMNVTGIMQIILSVMLIEGFQVNARPHASRFLSDKMRRMNEDYGLPFIPFNHRGLFEDPIPNKMESGLIEENGLHVKQPVRRSPKKKCKKGKCKKDNENNKR